MATVELVVSSTYDVRHKGKDLPMPTYRVLLDGEMIGTVSRSMITHERRSKGARYVNARWQSPGWRWSENGAFGLECQTRRDGIKRLLRKRGMDETLAETAKVVKP